jgi:hypothetical protein
MIYQSLMRNDPDNSAVAKAFKRVKAMDGGKDKGNEAFKCGKYQEAHDWYDPIALATNVLSAMDDTDAFFA